MSSIVLEVISFKRGSCNGVEQEEYKLKLYREGQVYTTWLFRPPKPITIRVGAVIEYAEIIDYVSCERVKEILEKEAIIQKNRPRVLEKPTIVPKFKPFVQKKPMASNKQLSLF